MNIKKLRVPLIIGIILIIISIIDITRIYWPVIVGERESLGAYSLQLMLPIALICLGIPFLCCGIKKTAAVLESKRSKGRFLIVSGSILLGLIMYFSIILLPEAADFIVAIVIVFLIAIAPIVMIALGSREVSKNRRKSIIKESIGTKIEAAPNVTYMLRIEKEVGESGVERINYICGYCGLKNNLKTIDKEHGIFQCLNCEAENHLLK
ncbi:MAG: hypothetical protein ACFE78_09835 [Candidatus Hodarchaeota archaeon]